MFIRLKRKGQSTLEYGIVIAVIVAALIAMQTYIKRGVQGRLRQATDDIGEQFSPGHTTGTTTLNSTVNATEEVTGGNQSKTITRSYQSQQRNVNESIQEFEQEYWK
jgi:uncharacterized protein (UPF0333 family)